MTDLVSAEARLSPTIREDWQTGSVIDVTVSVTRPINGWQVDVDAGGTIVNIWNAVVVSREGTYYRLAAADYNEQIRAGTSIEFGMQIDGSGDFRLLGAEMNLAADVAEATATDTQGPVTADGIPLPPVSDGPIPTPGAVPPRADQASPAQPAGSPTPQPAPAAPAQDGGGGPAFTLSVSSPTVVEPQGPAIDLEAFPPGPFSADGAHIVDSTGARAEINGINWFGFETEIAVAHGLWARNWRDMMDDMKSLGFNTVRIPFSGDFVATGGANVSGVDLGFNPDLAGLTGMEILDRIVDYADTIGLKILLDYHRGKPGGGPNDNGLWYGDGRTEADVIREWQTMAARYGDKPAVIGADLMNEPHMATWGDGSATDWGAAAGRIGNAVLQAAPDWLIVVEGVSVYEGDPYWWGGNLQGVADHPVRLADPSKLVYSIHDYPPSVFNQPWFSDGRSLPEVWDKNWGYIVKEGIAPVLVGEWGSFLATAADRAWAGELADYMRDLGTPWFWWSLNPNSGDTGGLFADDWTTVRPEVLTVLDPFLDDTRPAIALDASASSTDATFVVSLDAPAQSDILIKYATTDGTAEAGKDYVPVAGSVIFTAGTMDATINVPILPDMDPEGDEFFYLVLGAGSGSQASGTAVITEDGAAGDRTAGRRPALPTLDVAGTVFAEGADHAQFRIVLSAPTDRDIDFDFRIRAEDGTYAPGSAVIPAGSREAILEVPVDAETGRRFTLELTAADGAAIRDGQATARMADPGPVATASGASPTAETQLTIDLILEKDWGSGALFNVILKNISDQPVSAWSLAMDLPFDIAEIWDAGVVSDVGDRVTLQNEAWNGTIAPGEAIHFGFISTAGEILLNQIISGADFALVVQ
ncbi:chitinase, cellulase [Stappia sp. 22II-S9-Z10]|nr:chitinase, cellulase [Stappia sp. 22II-S9-Z10]